MIVGSLRNHFVSPIHQSIGRHVKFGIVGARGNYTHQRIDVLTVEQAVTVEITAGSRLRAVSEDCRDRFAWIQLDVGRIAAVIVVLLLFGLLIALGSTGAAPFIYSLF